MNKVVFLLSCSILHIVAASNRCDFVNTDKIMSSDSVEKHTLEIAGHKVDVWLPGQPPKGCILLLPGWNFSRTDWCERSSMCTQALERGFALVMPEMGKSVYAEHLFPETRADWRQYPTRPWLREQVIKEVSARFGLLKPGQNNFVVGLSTGARGAALLCLDMPDFWKGAALLSGDFDQTQMPSDNLMRGYYGSYKDFAERWKTVDNVIHRILEWRTPVYIGHGTEDKVVPPKQSKHLCEVLHKVYPQLKIVCHFPRAGHDYAYWGSEVKPILDFLESLI
jgi:pimeloyl-ACP methyl ester carboxylesterase